MSKIAPSILIFLMLIVAVVGLRMLMYGTPTKIQPTNIGLSGSSTSAEKVCSSADAILSPKNDFIVSKSNPSTISNDNLFLTLPNGWSAQRVEDSEIQVDIDNSDKANPLGIDISAVQFNLSCFASAQDMRNLWLAASNLENEKVYLDKLFGTRDAQSMGLGSYTYYGQTKDSVDGRNYIIDKYTNPFQGSQVHVTDYKVLLKNGFQYAFSFSVIGSFITEQAAKDFLSRMHFKD